MTSAFQDSLRTRNPGFTRRAATSTQPADDPPSRQAQYRLLVSRAVTQRLHSPSLIEAPSSTANTVEEWEKQDRRFAKASVEAGARLLGVSWPQFVRDVERASREVHYLKPTRYEGPNVSVAANRKAEIENGRHVYGMECEDQSKDVGEETWRKTQEGHITALSRFAKARRDC